MTIPAAFQGIADLYGEDKLKLFMRSSVMVVGLGGVGSWAVESLARTGVGKLILVDLDDICVSNINRQIHATTKNLGKLKALELKERIRLINPSAEVIVVEDFFSAQNADDILALACDYIIDAIDSVKSKALLVAKAREKNIPIIVTGGTAGKKDPSQIRFSDLNRSYNCKLLMQVRKRLKKEYGFTRFEKKKFHIPCLFSPEEQIMPLKSYDGSTKTNCQNGIGSVVHVTASFGFMAAAKALEHLAQGTDHAD